MKHIYGFFLILTFLSLPHINMSCQDIMKDNSQNHFYDLWEINSPLTVHLRNINFIPYLRLIVSNFVIYLNIHF